MTMPSGVGVRGAVAGVLALTLTLLVPNDGRAQLPQRPQADAGFRVAAFAAGSLRQGLGGLRIASDVHSASLRLSIRREGVHPFVQGVAFVRPDLECLPGAPCNDTGWAVHGGIRAPFSLDDTRPGTHVHLIAGAGWAFSEENRFSYALGLGFTTVVTNWLAPSLEFRWEDFPGIRNVLMVNLGFRLDPF